MFYRCVDVIIAKLGSWSEPTTAEITDVPIADGTIEWRGVPEVAETLEFIGRYAQGSSVRCI